jgi:hypothetical protein
MEVQLTIRGSYGEVTELIRNINKGLHIEGFPGAFEPVHHPHEEPSFSRDREDDRDPAYYEASPVLKGTPPPAPSPEVEGEVLTIRRKYARTEDERKKGKRQKAKVNGKREHSAEGLQIHCHTCGKLFHPRYADTVHCDKACYMVEWRETHKAKKEEKPVGCNTAPLAVPEPKKVLSEAEFQELSKKLKEIKASCPVPKGRPDYTRDLI